jgi:hypothetical protein
MGSPSAPDFDVVADDLYGLPAEEFIAARLRYEKQAKQAGDRELAARIHALAKPTVTAWLANQFTREHKADLQAFLELGAELREATRTLDGEQLRQLSRQQPQLVEAFVQQGRQLARAAGRTINEDTARGLEDTLRAALADEHASELLLSGRLSQPLQSDGFVPASEGGSAWTSVRPRAERVAPVASERRNDERERAERDLTEAEQAVSTAEAARQDAQARLSQAEHAAAEAAKQVQDLRRQLEAALSTQSKAEQHQLNLATALQRAEQDLGDAHRRQADARIRRDRLADAD